MATLLDDAFAKAKKEDRCALIAYVVAGDPDMETTRAVLDAVVEAGADIIELGVPYGDPLADGPTIAAAGQRALAAGATLENIFRLIPGTKAPVVLFTYVNPVLQYGVEKFALAAKRHGAVGVIVPDVSLEELEPIREAIRKNGLIMPLLISPTTPDERAKKITQTSEGFNYIVSRLGVTGKDAVDVEGLKDHAARVRRMTGFPIAAGFGISKAPQIVAIRDSVDGVIVGSALVEAYASQKGAAAAAAGASRLVRLLRLACKRAAPAAAGAKG
ncbi:MAG: tryptophan synthase subunit alpha [Candidatus Eremiobacteraeota bacterium]|nr:tryptophan synthase subunit alpha [Candidatus Eremiobacteraeota bacterium]